MKSAPTIRRRMAMLVLAAAAPAAVLVAGLLGLDHRRDREILERDSIATARAMVHAIDRELVSITAAAQVLATSERARQGNIPAFYRQAQQVVGKRIGVNIVLSDRNGQQLMNTLRPPGAPLPKHGNPEQLRAVFKTGKPVISDLYIGGVTRKPVMSVDVPVFDNGDVLYALSIGEAPERFGALLSQQQLPPGWIGAVFDRTGTIVARTQEHERFVGRKGARALVERMAKEPEGALETVTLEGIPVVSVLSRSPESGWTVALGIPQQAVSAHLWQRSRTAAAAAIVILALGLGLAWGIGGQVAESIRGLEEPAAQIGRREEIRVPQLGLREADEVGAALVRASQMIASAEHRAQHDALTGLANRALFRAVAAHQVELCKRTGGRFSILFVDLDEFKDVNDDFGHEAGDEVLMSVADRLRDAGRGSDLAARVGGDEFAVLLHDADAAAAAGVAAKLTDLLAAPHETSSRAVHCSASIGAATYPDAGDTPEELLRRADEAMYRVKSGRGRKSA